MDFSLTRVDRFPEGTTVGAYNASAWQPDSPPSGGAVKTGTMGPTRLVFSGLTEGGRYVAYALVNGEHRYIQFKASRRSDFPYGDADYAAYDPTSGKFAQANPAEVHLLDPKWGFTDDTWGTTVDLATSQLNVSRAQTFVEYVSDNGVVGVLPGSLTVQLGGSIRLRPYLNLRAAGKNSTVFGMHRDFAANGPAIAHDVDDDGHPIASPGVILQGFTVNCDYTNTTQYSTKTTTVGAANFLTSGVDTGDGTGSMYLASMTVDSTDGFSQETAMLFDVYDAVGDNVGRIESTSHDATHFFDCVFVSKSNSTPIDVPDGTVFRLAEVTASGGIRVSALDGLYIRDVRVENTAGYCMGFQNQLFETSGEHQKFDLILEDVELDGSYNADGLDAKDMVSCLLLRVKATNNYDKGINMRVLRGLLVGCECDTNGVNYQFQSNYSVSPAVYVRKTLGTGITAAAGQTLALSSATGWGTSGYCWIRAQEYAHYTRAALTVTFDVRGLAGTRAVAHQATSGTVPVYVVPVPGGTANTPPADAADSTVCMVNCHGWSARGVSVAIGGTGTGSIDAQIIGGSHTLSNKGVTVSSSYKPVTCAISGGCKITDNTNVTAGWGTGGGVFARGARVLIDSTVIIERNGGDGVELVSSIDSRINCVPKGNGGFGLKTSGGCEFLEWNGRADLSNASGPVSIGTMTTYYGSGFGVPSDTFQPLSYQEAIPLGSAAGTQTMSSGVAYGRRFTLAGPIKVSRLWAWVAATNTVTTGKLALATVSGATATVVAVTNNDTGRFGSLGDIRPAFASSATYWGYQGLEVVVLVLRVGGSAPDIAVRAGKAGTTVARKLRGVTVSGLTDIAIGDTLTLVEAANEPYVGVEV